jgi:hypothetical protein
MVAKKILPGFFSLLLGSVDDFGSVFREVGCSFLVLLGNRDCQG